MLTSTEVAALHGISRGRLSQLAKARGITPARTIGNVHLFTKAQAAALKPGKPGRPASPSVP